MSATTFLSRGLVSCILLLGTLPGAEPPKKDGPERPGGKKEKALAAIIDDLANRNPPPRLVNDGGWLPLFPAEYDWKEHDRILSALGKVHRESGLEMWEELVRRFGDRRYCLTLKDKNDYYALGNWDVGDFCVTLAHDWLLGVCDQHLPNDPIKEGFQLRLGVRLNGGLAKWRKQRADKQLYELQIEACEETIRQLAKVTTLPQHQKDSVRKKIEAEIATLRRTKSAIFTDYLTGGAGYNGPYTAKEAENIRERLRRKR